ncbi:hypothetical protein IGI04_008756 [Brassica rapa subsp. trilocularis]|uniref:Uncharacterized protein n=1 Tax=Brassica rapa subsp. trilocularis TaxID=1813537 RepID=A0ABQ7MVH0_BRACM|nr:hypothetical protein IGI04_008756 [Brassica rapa subsp. trilocularis]
MQQLGIYSTHRTSVGVRPHTQDVRGCPCVSVCVPLCPSAHTGRCSWLSISTHISPLVLGLSTLALPVDCLGDFGPRRLSVQYTQDVRGCPPAQTGRPSSHKGRLWLSVGVRQHTKDVCGCLRLSASTHRTSMCVRQHTQDVRVCPSAHTGRPWLSISTHISTLVLGLSKLALLMDCLGDIGPRRLFVQYKHDVCGCPSIHIGRLSLSMSVRLCPCLSVSTHRTSVAVHQYTYQHAGPWIHHAGPFRGLFGTHRTSVGVRPHTQDVRGCPCVSVCVPLCPSAHTGCSWLSISTHISTLVLGLSTLALPVDCSGDFGPRRLSVQYTQDVRGCPPAQTGRPSSHNGRLWLSVGVRQHTKDVCGCLRLSVSTHRTSMCVRQHTQDVRVCLSAHTGRSWLSTSTHISTLVLGLSKLALLMDCLGDIGPRRLSVQYKHDVCGCPSIQIGCLSLSMSVRLCPCLSVSTHRTSVAVHQYTYQHAGPLIHHAGPFRGLFGTHRTSVAVRVCPSAHTGSLWLSISTHISTLVLGLSTLALPVDCLGDFGLRGLSVQYTEDARGCPPAHIGRLWQSVRTHRTSMAVRVCPCLSVSTHWTSVAVHQYIYQHAGPWSQHASPSRGLFG